MMSVRHDAPDAATAAAHPTRGPVRTCVGCRRTDGQGALLRVAALEGRVVADPRRRVPGRGAYVHREKACLERAAKGLARGLRAAVAARDLAALEAAITAGDLAGWVAGQGDRDVVEDPPPHKA